MRSKLIILFFCLSFSLSAQTDCVNVDKLIEKLYKHYEGNEQWLKSMDSLFVLCPNNARIWDTRAHAYINRGDFKTGMLYITKAVELDPFYYLGDRAFTRMMYMHDYKGAIADLEQLEKVAGRTLVFTTNSTHMYIYKAISYQQLGEFDKALEAFNFAIGEQIEKQGEGWVGRFDYLFRGILKLKMEDFDGAIDDLTRQVPQFEILADTYYYRGLAYAAVGRKDEARTDLLKAKELMLGDGQRRWDGLVEVHGEVYLSDVETALVRLN